MRFSPASDCTRRLKLRAASTASGEFSSESAWGATVDSLRVRSCAALHEIANSQQWPELASGARVEIRRVCPGDAPAVVLATILGHDGSTASLPVTAHQLAAAVESLAPAQACTEVEHPNLAAWRAALADLEGNPAREAVAVFVADLDDPVTSEADGSMRATFEGHAPAL